MNLAKIDGYSGVKIQQLINSMLGPDIVYVEVGVHKGANFFNAIKGTGCRAYAIDNWSVYGNHKTSFNNYSVQCPDETITLLEGDCFSEEILQQIVGPIDVLFYDADHSKEAQKKAMTCFEPLFNDRVTLVIDDYVYTGSHVADDVQQGTEEGLNEIKDRWDIVSSKVYPEDGVIVRPANEHWWNGIRVIVLETPHETAMLS